MNTIIVTILSVVILVLCCVIRKTHRKFKDLRFLMGGLWAYHEHQIKIPEGLLVVTYYIRWQRQESFEPKAQYRFLKENLTSAADAQTEGFITQSLAHGLRDITTTVQ